MTYRLARVFWRGSCSLLLIGISAGILLMANSNYSHAAKDGVYTVSGFPIAAQAKDAVTAKKQAMDDGQIRAFRSLLKRIVPVTSYGRLPKLKLNHVQDMIEGFSIKSEQNSRTEYLATLEFKFRQAHIRQLLKSYGVPYVDAQAPKMLVIPHYLAAWPSAEGAGIAVAPTAEDGDAAERDEKAARDEKILKSRQRDWVRAWRDLDLKHALVPVALKAMHGKIHSDTINDLALGKEDALKIVLDEYEAKNILIALAGPGKDGRMAVRFIGADRIGRFNLSRGYRVYDDDFLYTAELASIVGLGVLEGRWKSVKASKVSTTAQQPWSTQEAIRVEVEFSGLYEWQQIRQKLSQMSSIDELKIGRLSARGADLSLSHSGSVAGLQSTLRAQGLILEDRGGQYSLRNR